MEQSRVRAGARTPQEEDARVPSRLLAVGHVTAGYPVAAPPALQGQVRVTSARSVHVCVHVTVKGPRPLGDSSDT